MFVLCKTHHYLSNEEANSRIQFGKVCSTRRGECNSEVERSPAAAAGFLLVGWTAGGQGRSVVGRFEATKARQQPTSPQGNKVWGLPKLALGTHSTSSSSSSSSLLSSAALIFEGISVSTQGSSMSDSRTIKIQKIDNGQ